MCVYVCVWRGVYVGVCVYVERCVCGCNVRLCVYMVYIGKVECECVFVYVCHVYVFVCVGIYRKS